MIRRIAVLAITLMLAACAGVSPGPSVKFAFDPGTDFSRVRTYSWIGKPEGGNPLMQQRIVEGIDSRLQAKGWRMVAANGNVHVDAHVSTRDKEDPNSRSATVGYTGWAGFGPPPPNAPAARDPLEVGTLVVDMYDGATRRPMWRGTATGTVNDDPAKMSALLQAALDKLFANFPPAK
jgi:Domain of unknown function (DUF4136)